DFRSSDGLYSKVKHKYSDTFRMGKDLFDACLLTTHGSINAFNHLMGVLRECILNATPTETHKFIKKLADMEKLKRVYTQNIDNLEELVGLHIDWQFEKVKNNKAQVVQLHGTLAKLRRNICTNIYDFTLQFCDIFKQGKAPKCTKCEERGKKCLDQTRKVSSYNWTAKSDNIKALIKDFARAVHNHNGYVILVNATDVVTKEWNSLIDFQIEGDCDEWVKLVNIELLNVKKMTTTRLSKN
ncbi:10830_t:CDS:2, partial [Racocetra persica]